MFQVASRFFSQNVPGRHHGPLQNLHPRCLVCHSISTISVLELIQYNEGRRGSCVEGAVWINCNAKPVRLNSSFKIMFHVQQILILCVFWNINFIKLSVLNYCRCFWLSMNYNIGYLWCSQPIFSKLSNYKQKSYVCIKVYSKNHTLAYYVKNIVSTSMRGTLRELCTVSTKI